jgi:hypothetical protein
MSTVLMSDRESIVLEIRYLASRIAVMQVPDETLIAELRYVKELATQCKNVLETGISRVPYSGVYGKGD